MSLLEIMENYDGEKGYLEGTTDRYEVLEVGNGKYFVNCAGYLKNKNVFIPFTPAYRLVKNPKSLPRPLLFQETAVTPVRKRSILIKIAEQMNEEDFENYKSEIEEFYDATRDLT